MALLPRCQKGLLAIYPIQPDVYTQIVDIYQDSGPIRNGEEVVGVFLHVLIRCHSTN